MTWETAIPLSVVSDHIAIFAHLDGDEKRGDGRP
jgi:hypothetical protein